MKKVTLTVVSMVFAATILSSVSYAQTNNGSNGSNGKMESSMAVEFRMDMRKLWEDHIAWTRSYIISSLSGSEDAEKVVERLLRNQEDIGDSIKIFYGKESGIHLAALLREHITIAAEVVKAAKEGSEDDLTKAFGKWSTNADEIALFLSGANPYLQQPDMKEMLHRHLEYTAGEVTSRLKKDWAADIDNYDRGHVHMLMFADMLANGIVSQFPNKFKR